MIFSRKGISVAMNIDPDLQSTKLVYGLAQDIHDEDLNELQAAVRREITPGSMIVVIQQQESDIKRKTSVAAIY